MLCNKCGHPRNYHQQAGYLGACSICACKEFVPPGDANEYNLPPDNPVEVIEPAYRPLTPIEAAALLEARDIRDPSGIGMIRSVDVSGVIVSGCRYTYQELLDKCTWRDSNEPCGVRLEPTC